MAMRLLADVNKGGDEAEIAASLPTSLALAASPAACAFITEAVIFPNEPPESVNKRQELISPFIQSRRSTTNGRRGRSGQSHLRVYPTSVCPRPMRGLKVGVLGIQGAVSEHVNALERLSSRYDQMEALEVVVIRSGPLPANLDGLIIPGGESTTIRSVAKRSSLWGELQAWVRAGHPTMGTCAGLVLLADQLDPNPEEGEDILGGLACQVQRNFFGPQSESFIAPIQVATGAPAELGTPKGVFIRAPAVKSVNAGRVLATVEKGGTDVIVAVEQGACLGLAFHPELTENTAWHAYFINMIKQKSKE